MMIAQESSLGSRVPSSGSVASPEKAMTSPTFQVSVGSGVRMVAVGALLSTVTVTGSLISEPSR